MSELVTDRLMRRAMSYAEYQRLPEQIRAEWIDGEVVVAPSPSFRHQQASRRLANLLEEALPNLVVVEAVTVVLVPKIRERIPDVVVVTEEPSGIITETPVIAVEVTSPGNRSEDTVRKSTDYLAAGVGQYWLADPTERTLDVFENSPDGWVVVARVDDQTPEASVIVRGYGTVSVTLSTMFGR
jgi:Uma2 family endonuclease